MLSRRPGRRIWASTIGAGAALRFPESLYRSQYLGPTLFLDEPAVGTRDYVLRPRLLKDPAFRQSISPQAAFEAFRGHYAEALKGAPFELMRELAARPDVDLGDMHFAQENLFSWETMAATAAYELSQDPQVPEAFVFEPPGRVGSRRTLPEMDMTYGVQIRPDDPLAFTSIIFGFLRGAARLTHKIVGREHLRPGAAGGFRLVAHPCLRYGCHSLLLLGQCGPGCCAVP